MANARDVVSQFKGLTLENVGSWPLAPRVAVWIFAIVVCAVFGWFVFWSKQTPEGIYLKGFKQEERKVNITGWAASNERVSEFLRNLQSNSKYLERPELIEIKIAGQNPQGVQRRLFDFSLNFFLKPTPERAQLASQGQPARPAAAVKK